MGSRWQVEKHKDPYYRRAKQEEYRSRASYKLKQLDKKYKLIKEGNTVVDLGAAPGGWSQVALEKVGEEGIVVELDYINNTMKQQFKLADRCKCKFIGIIGETERENNTIAVKNTKTGTQENIDIDKLINYLKEN